MTSGQALRRGGNVEHCKNWRGLPKEVKARTARAFRGEPQGAFISFASVELLWRVITPKRWELLQQMAGVGPLSVPNSPGGWGAMSNPYTVTCRRCSKAASSIAKRTAASSSRLTIHVDFVLSAA